MRALASISGRHVHADCPARRPDLTSSNEHVKPAAAAEIQQTSPGFQSGQRGGVAAGKSHVRALRQGFEFLDGITEFAGELVCILGRGTAARHARAAAAGGGVLGDLSVTFAHQLVNFLFRSGLDRGVHKIFSKSAAGRSLSGSSAKSCSAVGHRPRLARIGRGIFSPSSGLPGWPGARVCPAAGNKPSVPPCGTGSVPRDAEMGGRLGHGGRGEIQTIP